MLTQKVGVTNPGGSSGAWTFNLSFQTGSLAKYLRVGDVVVNAAGFNRRYQISTWSTYPTDFASGGLVTTVALDADLIPVQDSGYNSNVSTPGQSDLRPAMQTQGPTGNISVYSGQNYEYQMQMSPQDLGQANLAVVGDHIVDPTGKDFVISFLAGNKFSSPFRVREAEAVGIVPVAGTTTLYRATTNEHFYQGTALTLVSHNTITARDAVVSDRDGRDAQKLQGRTLAATAPSNTQVLTWNGTSNQWEPGTGGGAPATDLASATSTINISGATQPTNGQVLTASGPTAASWVTPTVTASGYATVVVAAPTGVGATDTAAINAAISALPSAGGAVVFREGTYVVNSTITLPGTKPVWLVGQGRGTQIAGTSSITAIFQAPATGNMRGITISDMDVDATNGGNQLLSMSTTGAQTFEDIKVSGVSMKNGQYLVYCTVDNNVASVVRNIEVSRCSVQDQYLVFFNGTYSANGTTERLSILNNKLYHTSSHLGVGCQFQGSGCVVSGNEFKGSSSQVAFAVGGSGCNYAVISNNVVDSAMFIGSSGGSSFLRNSVLSGNMNNSAGGISFDFNVSGLELSNCALIGNKSTQICDLKSSAPSGNNILLANVFSAITNQAPTDTIGYATFTVMAARPTGNTTTDLANLQAAFDAIPASGGTVLLREGSYTIAANLTIKAKTRVVGMGSKNTTLTNATNYVFFNAGSNINDVEFENIVLDGNKTLAYSVINQTAQVSGWKFINCRFLETVSFANQALAFNNFTLDRCEFSTPTQSDQWRWGNGSADCLNWIITNCRFSGGFMLFYSLRYAQISDCYFESAFASSPSSDYLQLFGAFQGVLANNVFVWTGTGTDVWMIHIVSNYSVVTGNKVVEFGGTHSGSLGILSDGSGSGNTFTGNWAETMKFSSSNNNVVAGNRITTYTQVGSTGNKIDVAAGLVTTTNPVDVSAATAPSAGQILAASSATAASWVNLSSRIVVLDSNAGSGGSATETMTVTGLLTTDTILAVTQKVKDANSTAIVAFGNQTNGTLDVTWTTAPGANAVVRLAVLR